MCSALRDLSPLGKRVCNKFSFSSDVWRRPWACIRRNALRASALPTFYLPLANARRAHTDYQVWVKTRFRGGQFEQAREAHEAGSHQRHLVG